MPDNPGYIVVGHSGVMALSRLAPGLFFSIGRGMVATVFRNRAEAKMAIRITERERKRDYPDETPWLRMRIVRLQVNHAR